MNLAICAATMRPEPVPGEVQSWIDRSAVCIGGSFQHNTSENNLGVVGSYQSLYESCHADILCYLHDDVVCREEGWDLRVLKEFEDPKVGIVGFGGALAHGSPDLYKVPYRLNDLARFDYMSNVDDWETHGARLEGSAEVAVLDGFVLCVRRRFLERAGGWPVHTPIGYIGYDYWACCMARRLGYKSVAVGVRCQHLGGRTFVQMNLADSQIKREEAHRFIYDSFRDALPWRVPR